MHFTLNVLSLGSDVPAWLARAEAMFAQAAASSPAMNALQTVGFSIIFFTGVVSVSALLAGVCQSVHRFAEARARRR